MILMHGRFKFQQLDLKMYDTLWSCGDEARYHSRTLERKYLYSVVIVTNKMYEEICCQSRAIAELWCGVVPCCSTIL
jgi:hypothetical protein